MADPVSDELAQLRAEIDRIDDAVVDLLLERIAVVRRIGTVKAAAPGIALRPAREAVIIRRLAARAAPLLPAAAVTRMWRELLAATTRLQTPFKVAVLRDPAAPHVGELARDHFATSTPLVPVETAHQGFRLVAAGEVELLVLPAPSEERFWWRQVAATLVDSPLRVVGRLPFCAAALGEGEPSPEPFQGALVPGALVLGALAEEASGADLTMLALETDLDISRVRLRDLIVAGGLDLVSIACLRDLQPESSFYLIEVEGMAHSALTGIRQAMGPLRDRVLRLDVLGSYPQPLETAAGQAPNDPL